MARQDEKVDLLIQHMESQGHATLNQAQANLTMVQLFKNP